MACGAMDVWCGAMLDVGSEAKNRPSEVEPDVLVGLACERNASQSDEDVGLHLLRRARERGGRGDASGHAGGLRFGDSVAQGFAAAPAVEFVEHGATEARSLGLARACDVGRESDVGQPI